MKFSAAKTAAPLIAAIFVSAALFGCEAVNETPAVSPTPASNPTPVTDGLDSSADYRQLNEFITEIRWPPVTNMTNEEELILFGSYVSRYINGDGAWVPRESVETVLSRYFGVEKINHEGSAGYTAAEEITDSPDDRDADSEGFYWMDGVGLMTHDWANVTGFYDNGDGTFTAEVDLYSSFAYWDDSLLEPFDQWVLKDGVEVTDTDNLWENADLDDENIYRCEFCLLTLKPFIYEGERTWQITGVNGVEVPRILFP